MDPMIIIAGMAALLQSVGTWYQVRDSRRASERFEDTYKITMEADAIGRGDIVQEARTLGRIIPGPILESMGQRLERCWTRYNEVLVGGFLPAEIDEATENVKRCVCRELRRLYELSGENIPEGTLSEWWNAYCVKR